VVGEGYFFLVGVLSWWSCCMLMIAWVSFRLIGGLHREVTS